MYMYIYIGYLFSPSDVVRIARTSGVWRPQGDAPIIKSPGPNTKQLKETSIASPQLQTRKRRDGEKGDGGAKRTPRPPATAAAAAQRSTAAAAGSSSKAQQARQQHSRKQHGKAAAKHSRSTAGGSTAAAAPAQQHTKKTPTKTGFRP